MALIYESKRMTLIWLHQHILSVAGLVAGTMCFQTEDVRVHWYRSTLAHSCSFVKWHRYTSGTTSKHQRVMWPGIYKMLIAFLHIVVWHIRMSACLQRSVTRLECNIYDLIVLLHTIHDITLSKNIMYVPHFRI